MEIKNVILKGMLFSIFSVLLNFSFKILVANTISKETLTLYFTSIDILSLALLILIGFRSSMVVTFAKTKDDTSIINIFRYILIFLVVSVWLFLIPYIKTKLTIEDSYPLLVGILLTTAISTYLNNQMSMYRLYTAINNITIFDPIFSILIFSIFVFIFNFKTVEIMFVTNIISSILISLYVYYKKSQNINEPKISLVKITPTMKLFLQRSLISTLEFGSGILMMYMAVIFLMNYFTLNELGNFQIVVKPMYMYMVTLFIFPIVRFSLPELSKFISNKEFEKVEELSKWVYKLAFIVGFCFIVFVYFFGENFITFFFSIQYQKAYEMLFILSFAFIFIMSNSYQVTLIKACGNFLTALFIRIFGITIFMSSFYTLKLFYFDARVVILSLLIGYISMFLVSFYFENRYLKELKLF